MKFRINYLFLVGTQFQFYTFHIYKLNSDERGNSQSNSFANTLNLRDDI